MPGVQGNVIKRMLGNHIYILPPDKFMEIHGDSLFLLPRPHEPLNNAIDHFQLSLAQHSARGSIGIILPGEVSDGAKGLKF